MQRRRSESRRSLCLVIPLVALAALAGVAPLRGQVPASPASTATSRDKLYQEIADEVAALERQGNLLKRVVQLVTPTVVHIEAEKTEDRNAAPSHRSIEEAGSGVIIQHREQHYVLTNRHVIKDSLLSGIKLKLSDGRVIHPTKVWTDRATDIAVMAVKADDLVAARLADSDKVEIGDFVLAVGSPFGLSHSVTYGIVSAKGRRDLKLGDGSVKYQNFLQTDAAINPGNSGGPLLNLRGEVIGINTAIASSSGGSEGIGFSIPINMGLRVATQLIDQGNVVRAYLGVRLDREFNPARATELGLSRPAGALVTGVTPNSPAATADLRAGDVILRVNDTPIEDDAHLVNLVSLTPVGESVRLLVYRDGQSVNLQIEVGNRNEYEPE